MHTTPVVELCARCLEGPSGTQGHSRLAFYVTGPYPGHSIFKCEECGDRWIRHYGGSEAFAWTRYALQFGGTQRPPGKPR